MSEAELKRCPFCGSVPAIKDSEDKNPLYRWTVRCGNHYCPVPTIASRPEREQAITAWNTRSASTADAQKEREAIITLIEQTKGHWLWRMAHDEFLSAEYEVRSLAEKLISDIRGGGHLTHEE
jgi:hypothetical protein